VTERIINIKEISRKEENIMLKEWLLILLAMTTGIVFPVIQKIVAGVALNSDEKLGFAIELVVIIALIVWIKSLNTKAKLDRIKELKQIFREMINELKENK
jgi:hypothetical protein